MSTLKNSFGIFGVPEMLRISDIYNTSKNGDTLELITDVLSSRKEIEKCIMANGYAPEHNFGYWMWLQENGKKNVFIKFPGKEGIFAQHNEKLNNWYFISLPIAKESNRVRILAEAVKYIFTKNPKKINIELPAEMKREFSKEAKKLSIRIGSNNYVYNWPVFEMKQLDDGLKGRKWKKLRNMRNRFYKGNKVKVVDSRKIPKEELKKIVSDWVKKRTAIDSPLRERYYNMIELNFDGADFARTLVVNKIPCSITAGWKIPNSHDYYSGVGIYNYKFEGIGEAANLDDLSFLKKKGFEKVDFGGSGKALLQFKKKFRPAYIYKTYSFPVWRR